MFSAINSQLTLAGISTESENQYLERKGRDVGIKKLAQELIGFLNADGGVLAFGISDAGVIEDLNDLDEVSLNNFRTIVQDQIQPPARIELEEITLEDGALIFLYHMEPESERVFCHKDSEDVFRRIADRNKKLNREEVQALEYDRHIRKFEEESRPDFDMRDLNPAVCENYLKQMHFEGTFEELSLKRVLAKRQKSGDGVVLNNAGILLFATTPAQYIPNASVRYVRYDGAHQQSGKSFNVIKDERFEDCLPRLIEKLKDFLKASFRDYFYLNMDSGKFEKIQEFPEEAWLEGIVNAICHRSYNVQGNEILLKHYDDRFEISNSGPLPSQVTVENIREERFSRNPRIARVLAEMGYVRELNEGVPRIYGAMADSMLAEPIYREQNQTIYLTLKNNVTKQKETILLEINRRIESAWDSLHETTRHLIGFLIMHHETTVAQAAQALNVTEKTARNHLQILCDKSILERVSEKERDKHAIYRFSEK
jgi:ATP-dependent DNA helicase RecG